MMDGSSGQISCSFAEIIKIAYPGMELNFGNNGLGSCKVKVIYEDRLEVECLKDFEIMEE